MPCNDALGTECCSRNGNVDTTNTRPCSLDGCSRVTGPSVDLRRMPDIFQARRHIVERHQSPVDDVMEEYVRAAFDQTVFVCPFYKPCRRAWGAI